MIKIPTIEDKIYGFFLELFDEYPKDEIKEYVDDALKLNNLSMDILIGQILQGVENGYSIEEQFEVMKEIFKNFK